MTKVVNYFDSSLVMSFAKHQYKKWLRARILIKNIYLYSMINRIIDRIRYYICKNFKQSLLREIITSINDKNNKKVLYNSRIRNSIVCIYKSCKERMANFIRGYLAVKRVKEEML